MRPRWDCTVPNWRILPRSVETDDWTESAKRGKSREPAIDSMKNSVSLGATVCNDSHHKKDRVAQKPWPLELDAGTYRR